MFCLLGRVVSVQFSRSFMSYSLWPHRLQHSRLPCPSSTPGASSNSCPLSQWCHPTISSSVVHFSSCLQSFPASGSFPMSPFFPSDDQSIGVSASVLPMNIQYMCCRSKHSMNIQDWFPFGIHWFDLLAVQGTLKSLLPYYSLKESILWLSTFFIFQLSHPYMTTGKTIALTRQTFAGKLMSLNFNMLSRLVIGFLGMLHSKR